jgi:hypothetical protein
MNWLTPSSSKYSPYGTKAALDKFKADGITTWPVVGSGTPASSGMSYGILAANVSRSWKYTYVKAVECWVDVLS